MKKMIASGSIRCETSKQWAAENPLKTKCMKSMQTHGTFCDMMLNKEQKQIEQIENIMNFNPNISIITLTIKDLNTMIENKDFQIR